VRVREQQPEDNVFDLDPLKKDFRNFLWVVWKRLNLPSPTKVQYDIASYLQHGPRRLMIEAFRGVGKSWITSAFVVWLLLNDPTCNIMVVSGSKDRADDFSTFTMQLLEVIPEIGHLLPKDPMRWSKIAFDVEGAIASHAPSVKSRGIFGQLTGGRADVIIADDIETPKNSETQVQREKLSGRVKEFDAVLKPDGRTIYLGTPQTEDSIYNLLPERGYEVRIWPSRYPRKEQLPGYGDRLAPIIAEALDEDPALEWTPTDPERFDDVDLAEREASYGRSGFDLQFQLDTSLADHNRYPLKLADLIVMDLDTEVGPAKVVWGGSPDLAIRDLPNVGMQGDLFHRPMAIQGDYMPYDGAVMVVDPSGRGNDETAWAVVKRLNGQLFLLECQGVRGGYEQETLELLARRAAFHKVPLVLTEPNWGGGMFSQLLRPVMNRIHRCRVEDTVWSQQQKERRIADTLEPILNSHRLIVNTTVVKTDARTASATDAQSGLWRQLFYQMTRLTRQRDSLKHDDRLDALALGVGHWVQSLAADVDDAVRIARERAAAEDLRTFFDNTIGRKPDKPSFLRVPQHQKRK